MSDLLPCPFCGGRKITHSELDFCTVCLTCSSCGPAVDCVDTSLAEETWMESGVIVGIQLADGRSDVIEREGDFTFKGEELLGGWAKVHRRDRSRPMYRRLKLATFSTGRSRWNADPAGMIVKCAEADALRSTFPTLLGGLYMQEERPEIVLEQEKHIPAAKFGQPKATPALEAPKTVVKLPPREQEPQAVEPQAVETTAVDEASQPKGAAATPPEQSTTPAPSAPVPVAPPQPAAPAGPDPAALRKSLYARAAKLNIGRKILGVKLAEHGFISDGDDIESMDAAALSAIDDSWTEFEDAIRNPGGNA